MQVVVVNLHCDPPSFQNSGSETVLINLLKLGTHNKDLEQPPEVRGSFQSALQADVYLPGLYLLVDVDCGHRYGRHDRHRHWNHWENTLVQLHKEYFYLMYCGSYTTRRKCSIFEVICQNQMLFFQKHLLATSRKLYLSGSLRAVRPARHRYPLPLRN